MTLAQLQQLTTSGLLLASAAWAWVAWRSGHPHAAAAGALLIVGGYAIVLALELLLLRHAHGDDPTPRATLRQLVGAWWGETRSAPRVFCWRQPFRSRRWPDHLPDDAAGRRGVLLVHGYVCNRGLWNPWMARLRAQGVPYVAVNLEPIFGSIDDYTAAIDEGVRRLTQATGRPPLAVAHSMGGLALRHWWSLQAQPALLHHAITIGTPHRGTWLARFAFSPNAQQMQQHSPWLQALYQREPRGHAKRFTCFYGHCDNIVFPPCSGTLEGADNRHLSGVAHVHMVTRREPWDELLRRLSD